MSFFFSFNCTGGGIGDYPQLPDIPVEQRDITYPYDLPDQRRNFGEAVSEYKEKSSIFHRQMLKLHAYTISIHSMQFLDAY